MQIDFQQERGQIQIRIQGHAGYAPAGEDIVCAATSMLGALLEETLLRENTQGLACVSCPYKRAAESWNWISPLPSPAGAACPRYWKPWNTASDCWQTSIPAMFL